MRSVFLALVLVAGLIWAASGSAPAQSQTDGKAVSCQTCGNTAACPHCSAGQDCPRCAEGTACAKCNQGEACGHRGKGHPHHGKWGSHNWDYKCVRPAKKPEAMTQQFSGLGAEGWRLVEADAGLWCFSRMRSAK